MILRVRTLRFRFRALDTVWFPPGKAANIFRGALGRNLRRAVCDPDCNDARTCQKARDCVYAKLFEPRGGGSAPSGFADSPRPFVLRAAPLDGRRFGPGSEFTLDVNVFDLHAAPLDALSQAFARLRVEGLGPGRPRAELVHVGESGTVLLKLTTEREKVSRIRVTFVTPTELKIAGDVLREPRFDALLKRARDRVTGLLGLYQEGSFNTQFLRELGDRAGAVRMTAGRFDEIETERRSSRTGQTHRLGGFTGVAEYEGELTEFLPWLEAAWWTGVGRLTVWGNGLIETEVL